MLIRRRVALAAFHFAVLLGVFVLARAIASPWGEVPLAVGAVVLLELALVVWWTTARALARDAGGQLMTAEAFRRAGVRWGAIAGVVFWVGLLATWIVFGLGSVWFFEPANVEYNMIGGRYAVVVLSIFALIPGAAVSAGVGAALGGTLGVIDRALLPIAHWTSRPPSNR